MPVFHTKTIESILEPVAQQVSRLVILHEEAEDGNAMPDLARPVQVVKMAVDNLVKVGYDTVNVSEDQILKQDMPPALQRVDESSFLLLDASDMLRADPYSAPARKKLIEGSRGILQGTSALLLAFDESEVRKIIRICKSVLEYLAITEVVESMEDLVTFVKNLSPVLTKMAKEVDLREKELTHQVHREMLVRSLDEVKALTPVLISAVKIFVSTKSQGANGVKESQENRDFVVGKLCDEINEIIRVLQLTTYDEDEWEADDLAVMKKAQNAISGKMKQASDWLLDPYGPVGGAGEKAIHQMLEDAMKVADRCANPEDREAISKAVGDIQSMVDALSELRAQGKGDTPQAVSLARGIQQKLAELQQKVNKAVANQEKAEVLKMAHTVAGKVDQAQRWLQNPGLNDGGLGEQAARSVVQEGRKVADLLQGADRSELLKLCDETEKLTNQLADLCRKGMGNSPQAKAIARNLSEKLDELKNKISKALVQKVADDFMDITTPLKQLTDAALAPPGMPGRDENFQDKAYKFDQHSKQLANTARLVAAAGAGDNKRQVESINSTAQQINDLTPQVIQAAKVVLLNPQNQAAQENFDLMKKQWTDNMEKLRGLVDEATDTVALIKAAEEGILRDTEKTESAIKRGDAQGIVGNTSNIARLANRVVQAGEKEAENSEDPTYVQKIGSATENLKASIAPMVRDAKFLASNPRDPSAANNWRASNNRLIDGVQGVRGVVEEAYPEFPPPPDLTQLSLDAPPRPPLPHESAPPRPPPPETDDEDEETFERRYPEPQANQPIMMAAHALHREVKQWSSKDNEIISAAKRMAMLMAKLSQLVRGDGGSKKELIATAKQISEASEEVTRLAKKLAQECTDKKMRTNLLQVCERIPTIGTQLKILSTVKATMLGAQESSSEEDQEATEMLVGNAQNLMQAVRETVRAAEAASIKIRVDSGYSMRWVRRSPWYAT